MSMSYRHNSGTFVGRGGCEIFFQSWSAQSTRGAIVLVHGVGEHSGRYGNIIGRLDGKKISVYAHDHRGHGKSGGKRGHIDSIEDYIYDLKTFVDYIRDQNKKIPMVLFGHSMGGLIALKYALTYPEDMDALVLSSPGLVPSFRVPAWKSALGRLLSRLMPDLQMRSGIDPGHVSRDEKVVRAYVEDPMVHDLVTARWFTEITSTAGECMERAGELTMPLLVFHGKDDKIVDFSGSVRVFENFRSKNKELRMFDGLYHETMNEPETDRKKVLDYVERWLMKNVFSPKKSPVQKRKPAPVKKKKRKA